MLIEAVFLQARSSAAIRSLHGVPSELVGCRRARHAVIKSPTTMARSEFTQSGPAGGSPTSTEARQSSAPYTHIAAGPELDVVGRRFVVHLRHREFDPFRANPHVASLASFRDLIARLTRAPVPLSAHSE
ncbi:hypothetical protein ACH4OY_10815 [Micromonospora rubida]|uniref:Uncharacterized protein n=1 Tax=Micromonospora rubida TaxID=2697657 RepID=A0ABW7SHK5_9ACTN